MRGIRLPIKHYLNNNLKDLYWSEYPEINRDRRKRLEPNKTAARSFQRRLKVLSEAIKELNLDIQGAGEEKPAGPG